MTAESAAALVVACATLASALASLVVALRTGKKVSETHNLVNGQAQVVQALAEARGHAAGVIEGAASERPDDVKRIPDEQHEERTADAQLPP
jgi:hypothetical protein